MTHTSDVDMVFAYPPTRAERRRSYLDGSERREEPKAMTGDTAKVRHIAPQGAFNGMIKRDSRKGDDDEN